MITLLIGHRGVGKTSFLRALRGECESREEDALFLDLDVEIERESGKSIAEIFAQEKEAGFRQWELKIFEKCLQQARDQGRRRSFMALGAGFSAVIPADCWVVWLRRSSDRQGRIFLDRPRLNAKLDPLQEFLQRREERDPHYGLRADEELFLREGEERLSAAALRMFFSDPTEKVGGILTLLPNLFERTSRWSNWWMRRALWGLDYFEIRTDLLPQDFAQLAGQDIPAEKILLSFRPGGWHKEIPGAKVDWALEMGARPLRRPDILSLHERETSLASTLQTLAQKGEQYQAHHLKAAPEIHTWQELRELHNWWEQDPRGRSVLPRSESGRWAWYRLLMKKRMALNFWREGQGSGVDQPTLAQWLATPDQSLGFAAVLGAPVEHSHSPVFHQDFFAAYRWPFFAIEVQSEEWDEALSLLTRLGLRAAAVTAPLKERAGAGTAINTLAFQPDTHSRKASNTDGLGLQNWRAQLPKTQGPLVVWGGGGVLASVREAFPEGVEFSARTAQPRGGGKLHGSPEVLIWAVGRSRLEQTQSPPPSWRPRFVLDLNYSEDSPGRDYALRVGAKYIGGEPFFAAQARAQQQFWQQNL